MDILCSDKTGTLTLNKLTVDHVNTYPLSGHTIEEARRCRLVGVPAGWLAAWLSLVPVLPRRRAQHC